MSILQVIVPVTPQRLHFLEECLRSVKKNSPVDHLVNVVIGGPATQEKVGEIVAIARSVYDRTGLVISCADEGHGYNGMVLDVLRNSDFQYTVVLPVTHRIADHEWFGKMQLPHIRAPMCAMTFAPDEEAANTNASFPWHWRNKVTSKFFMLQRSSIGTAKDAAIDFDGDDIANAIRDQLRNVGARCWAVPSCRITQLIADPQ